MTAAQTAAEMILRAAGTSLKNYTWGQTREKIFAAAQAILDESRQAVLEEAVQAAIDNQDSTPWEIADAIRALKNKGA